MSANNDPRVVFTKTVFRSFSGQNVPWTLRVLVFLLLPFFLLFVLAMVLLGFCILATTLLVQGVRSLVWGTSMTQVSVVRRHDLTGNAPGLNDAGGTRGPIIDILPEPQATPGHR